MIRISRHDKKKLRTILLCYTGNPDARKIKCGKSDWIELRNHFVVWMCLFSLEDRKIANTIKPKNML